MEMKENKQSNVILIAILGGIIVATVLIIGTIMIGHRASNDTQNAVHNVSLLYLDELAQRRQQVVSATINGYISDIGIALGIMEPEDLSSTENLHAYQSKIKQLYRFERFAFVDEEGLIHTSTGTRTDIADYDFDYKTLSGSKVFVKTNSSGEKRVAIAVSVDHLPYEGHKLVACLCEIDMDVLLDAMSLRGDNNNNTTFCNIYTKDGVALTDAVLGGLASEDNLLGALEHAELFKGYSLEQVIDDFENHHEGYVSFSYNGIQETLYYVPVQRTDWMLSYLIRESLVGEQIQQVSDSIISRSVWQSILTAAVLVLVFSVLIGQLRRNSRITLEKEVSETENRVRQQELEEQVAIQEELLEQEKKRVEQDSMITALSSDYRSVYYVDLEQDTAICYRRDRNINSPYAEQKQFPFTEAFEYYANHYVTEAYREDFLNFISREHIQDALQKDLIISIRYLVHRGNEEKYESLRMAGVRHPDDRAGHVVHAVGAAFADIDSEMRESMAKNEMLAQALKTAEDANRAKSRFVSDMSHEIRTPITAILGMNEMIHRECEDNTILGYSDTIEKAGTSLLGIISDILDFSKIESGKMELVEVCYSLPGMIRDLYNLIYFRADGKGLEVDLDIDETLPRELFGDELRVKQIIANLLTNAVKYTDEGRIKLTIRRESLLDESVSMFVEVSDTGIGIKKDDMEKLFSSFERLETERNRTVEGAGLGLTITSELLGQMGSRLEVDSTHGVGSRFFFTLRQGIADATQIGHFDMEVALSDDKGPKSNQTPFKAPGAKILIVDDTPMNLQVIRALLKRTGMQIDTAASGMECIELFDKNEYNMIFLDYRMPGLDGIETIQEIAARFPEKFKRVPIISLTASAVSGDREKMIEAGFTDYLAKPVNVNDMENMLRKYLPKELQEDESSFDSEDGDDGEIKKLSPKLFSIKLLDLKKGIEYCGDAEDYTDALITYRDSIEERSKKLEDDMSADDIESFTIDIHSLKSMSRAAGASSLADRAAEMETAAKAGERDKIKALLPGFLEDYRSLLRELSEL
jgi:signal transduction histidine kinase/CheY-like chemotaxis protein/HPt (histidine-containing phosphotransfer) domain-containing protein